MKIAYVFDRNNGNVFTHSYVCQESPLEPGKFIIPTDSLLTAPSIVVGTWPIAVNGVWVNAPDYRKQIWYNQKTGEPTEITEIGTPSIELGPTIPQSILDAKAALPNISGFIATLKLDMGIIECNALAVSYPLFFTSIRESDWDSVQMLAIDAKKILSTEQYNTIKTIALANNIPIKL